MTEKAQGPSVHATAQLGFMAAREYGECGNRHRDPVSIYDKVGVRAMTDNRRTRQDWNELSRQNEKLQQENERLRFILRSICRTMAQYSSECDQLIEEPPENPS